MAGNMGFEDGWTYYLGSWLSRWMGDIDQYDLSAWDRIDGNASSQN
jgi:hypothetical protein